MRKNTKVSIITAVLNNKEYIEGCIKSVSAQTYKDIEHIIIDGGSCDGTKEILNSYSNDIAKIIFDNKKGIYNALNKGIDEATGDIIGILHADDLYVDNCVIEKVVGVFNNENADGVYGDLLYVNKNYPDKIIRYWQAGDFKASKLKSGWIPPHPALFLRKELYQRFGSYDPLFTIASDYDFMLRLFLKKEIKISYLREILVKMRLGGVSNRDLGCLFKKSSQDYKILKKNSIPFPLLTLAIKNFSKIPQFIKDKR